MPLVRMKEDLQDLRPMSRGLLMVQRPPSSLDRTRESRHRVLQSDSGPSIECGPEVKRSAADIENLLSQKVPESQDLLRAAFWALDPEGRLAVTRGQFRHVVEGIPLLLTQPEFEALLARVPKKGNGTVAYQEWLEKYCRTQTAENRSPPSPTQQCSMLAELQRRLPDKSSQPSSNLKNIVGAFRLFDRHRDGRVQRGELREILENHGFPMSKKEFHKLWYHYNPKNTGTVSCSQVLQMLSVDSENQRNTEAESAKSVTSPAALNQNTVNQEKIGQQNTTEPWTEESEDNCFQELTLDEIQTLFQEKLSLNYSAVRQALEGFDSACSGFLSMKNLKTVLCNLLFPMSAITFQSLMSRFGVEATGPVSWREFLAQGWDTAKRGGQTMPGREDLLQELPVRSSASSALRKLEERIPQKAAFLIPSQLLDDCGIFLEENQFDILVETLGIRDGKLAHSEFVPKCKDSTVSEEDMHTCQRWTPGVNGEPVGFPTAEECFLQMKERIKEFHGDFLTAFRFMDKNHDGVISRQDFRDLFDSLMLVTKETEYGRLLDLLGLRPGATLNYSEFCSLVQSSGSTAAFPRPTTRPTESLLDACDQIHSYLVWKAHRRWSDMAKALCHFDQDGQSIILKRDLRHLLYTYGTPITPNEFEILWQRYDRGGRGYITQLEFMKKLGVDPMETKHGPDQLSPGQRADGEPRGRSTRANSRVLHTRAPQELRMGIRSAAGTPSYLELIHTLDGRASTMSGCRLQSVATTESAESLETALLRIRELVTASYETLRKVFSKLDKSQRGTVQLWKLRQVLDHFCLVLTDRQFAHLLGGMEVEARDGAVSWKEFLRRFRLGGQETAEECNEDVGMVGKSKGGSSLPVSDILRQIPKVISSNQNVIAKDTADLDDAHDDVMSKENFKAVCDGHFMTLTSEQFENLWNRLPANSFGNLEHRSSLKSFGGRPVENPEGRGGAAGRAPSKRATRTATMVPGLLRRPKSTSSFSRSPEAVEQTRRPCSSREGTTNLPKSEREEPGLWGSIHTSWREIHRRCMEVDREGLREVGVEQFLAIMEELQIKTTRLEFEQLAAEYDVMRDGKFSYPAFLRHFVVTPGPPRKHAYERPKIQIPRTPMSAGVLSGPCVDAFLKMQGRIQQFWRGMRRSFVTLDRNRSGSISLQDFRKVLRQYSVNLSEEEFFQICSFFDKNISGKISYNDFLRTFLK